MTKVTAIVVALLAVSVGMCADTLVDVYVDGKKVDFRPQARVRGETTYAPLRATAESLGADVKWHAQQQMAVLCRGNSCVSVRKSEGIIVADQMLVPLRILSEALGAKVKWDGTKRAVIINTPGG